MGWRASWSTPRFGGRSARDVAGAHGLSKSWTHELLARFRVGSYEALEPRSRRFRRCPHEIPRELVDEEAGIRATTRHTRKSAEWLYAGENVAGWVLLIAVAGRNHPDRQGDLPSNFGVV